MARCGVQPSGRGNVTAQDNTESLTYEVDTSVALSAAVMSSPEEADLPSPFAAPVPIPTAIRRHDNMQQTMQLPTRFNGLVENALVYISGFVVRQTLKRMTCDACRASLVRDASSTRQDDAYHLLTLKNNGGLMIPSEGTVKVVRVAEWVIRQASATRSGCLSTSSQGLQMEISLLGYIWHI